MARLPDRIRAKRGRSIPKTWQAMERWVDGYGTQFNGAGIRLRELPGEVIAYASRAGGSWRHPWKMTMSGLSVQLRPGTVNFEMPRAPAPGNESQLLTLDGLDDKGEQTGLRPLVRLDEKENSGAGPDGRSFICVRLMVDPEDGEPMIKSQPEKWLTMVHRPELPRGFQAGAMPEVVEDDVSVGYFPVAIIYWDKNGTNPVRYFQCSNHNLQHEFIPGAENEDGSFKPNRHAFYV